MEGSSDSGSIAQSQTIQQSAANNPKKTAWTVSYPELFLQKIGEQDNENSLIDWEEMNKSGGGGVDVDRTEKVRQSIKVNGLC